MTSALATDVDAPRASTGLSALHAAIDLLQAETTGADHAHRLAVIERAIRRLQSLKLEVVAAADADQVADQTGMTDTTAWLARHTRSGSSHAARDVHLATALAASPVSGPRPCADALARGALTVEHVRIIVQATDQLPARLGTAAVAVVERNLVELASRVAPAQLRRAARRALAAVEPDEHLVDLHEDMLLRAEERSALARTRLTLHDNNDGTTTGHFTVPTVGAAILTRVIQSMTAPRRARLGAPQAQAGDPAARRDWAHQAGLAFVELLEHLPTDHLHSKVAATVVVTLDHQHLADALGAAGLDTGDAISAADVRRLACGAGIVPVVLGGASLPLDLGRSSRLFSESQRVALATQHLTCAAHGCERPFAWCELHHRDPWGRGGPTDLANAIPLCGFHHRRIHDPSYDHRHEGGGVMFAKQQSANQRR